MTGTPSLDTADLSLVLPAYNEQARLPIALERLAAFGAESGLALEIVVADDGSEDATPHIARTWESACADLPFRVRLNRIRHRGKGAAVRSGMAQAQGDVVGYCDVDLSAGPDAVEQLYRVVKGGADLVMASRGLPASELAIRQPWYRERLGRTFNVALRSLTGLPFRDTQCGLKLFRRHAADDIFRHQRLDGFAFDAEVVVLALRLGYAVEEIPIRWVHAEGSKVSLVRDSLRMGRDIVRIVRRLGKGAVHAPGVPISAAIDGFAAAEDRHCAHVAKRGLVLRAIEESGVHGPCLDLGCGTGAMLDEVGAMMPAVGIDLSLRSLGHARMRGIGALARADGDALPFREGSFGAVLALDVIEHHPRPEELLREARRVLRPDGCMVLTVPAFQWMWTYHDHLLGHYRRYTRERLVAELEAAGLEVRYATYFQSWLLPMAWVFRRVKALAGRGTRPDAWVPPGPLNKALLALAETEARYLQGHRVPFGLSVLAVAGQGTTG
jgi:dolichyl-phosphate beta-glucosyltransferase